MTFYRGISRRKSGGIPLPLAGGARGGLENISAALSALAPPLSAQASALRRAPQAWGKFLAAILILNVSLLFSSPSFANSTCYSDAEFEAENILRLHSELMVITVTCRQASDGRSLVPAYTGFTKRNIALLHGAEQTMSRYFNERGENGEEKLDVMRTKLANEFGQKIARMSSQPFCDKYRDKVMNYYKASAEDVMDEVEQMQINYKSYVKPCSAQTHVVRK